MYIIPLVPGSQQFVVKIKETDYIFRIIFRLDTYVLDILTPNSQPIVSGLSLVPASDLLTQLKYLNLGFNLYVVTDSTYTSDTDMYAALGTSVKLGFTYD
jgi:hypothetical protein